jgi:hypothetical protein
MQMGMATISWLKIVTTCCAEASFTAEERCYQVQCVAHGCTGYSLRVTGQHLQHNRWATGCTYRVYVNDMRVTAEDVNCRR